MGSRCRCTLARRQGVADSSGEVGIAPNVLLTYVVYPPKLLEARDTTLTQGVPMEPAAASTDQPSTELSASPEAELPLPIEASPADGVDRPRGAVRTFHDEVLAYFLSQMWYDLIFVHVLRLRPRPFCE